MLLAVIKKEIRGHVVSARYVICTVILLVLAILSAWVGTTDYVLRMERYQNHLEDEKVERESLLVYSYLEPMLSRQPEPLSVLERGFEGRLASEVPISIYEIPLRPQEEARGNAYLGSLRSLDFTMLVRLVLGLLALLLTFNAINEEKANGNLRFVLAQGVSRKLLLTGKLLGAFVALLAPLLLSLGVSVWILHVQGSVPLDPTLWRRLLALILAYLAYLVLMVLLGLLLSLRSERTSSALVLSLLAWLLIVFLIPQSAVAVASGWTQEVCGPQVLKRHLDEVRRQRGQEVAELNTRFPIFNDGAHRPPVLLLDDRRVRFRFGSAAYYDARASYFQEETRIGMAYANEIYKIRRECGAAVENAERTANLLASFSPAFLLERLAESFAATSAADFDRFYEECRAYRETLIEYLREQEIFRSWQWFTDDVEPYPWTSFLGVADPSTLRPEEARALFTQFHTPEIQKQVRLREENYNNNPSRRLNLDDLPELQRRKLGVGEQALRVRGEILGLFLLSCFLTGVVFLDFERYGLG